MPATGSGEAEGMEANNQQASDGKASCQACISRGYDRDGDGCEMMNAGEKLTDEVVDERLREVDLDGNQVDLDQ